MSDFVRFDASIKNTTCCPAIRNSCWEKRIFPAKDWIPGICISIIPVLLNGLHMKWEFCKEGDKAYEEEG